MPIGTVVLLPSVDLPERRRDVWTTRRELAAELMAYGVGVLVIPDVPETDPSDVRMATAHWVAHSAMTLTAAQPQRPVLLVASGAAGSLLPALGFSQKASRRPVAGYVVIDGDLPKAGAADWPDAPVTYIAASAADQNLRTAELRGWTVETNPEPSQVLRSIAAE